MAKKIVFSSTPVVRIDISCKGSEDKELVKKLQKFMDENKIYHAVRGGMGGPEYSIAYYSQEDADKIEQWLLENNATKIPIEEFSLDD